MRNRCSFLGTLTPPHLRGDLGQRTLPLFVDLAEKRISELPEDRTILLLSQHSPTVKHPTVGLCTDRLRISCEGTSHLVGASHPTVHVAGRAVKRRQVMDGLDRSGGSGEEAQLIRSYRNLRYGDVWRHCDVAAEGPVVPNRVGSVRLDL